ncbi:helix-turn-helix transcriptional regulator [bacterium]|nr:helix-turn-helix transcriptional regulator [bacterium]
MTSKDINKKIGTKIKLERIKRKLSQEKLAELADLNKNSIGFIERGESSPTAETLAKIADAFNITFSELADVSKVEL